MMNLRPIAIPAKQERFFLTMTSDLRVDPAIAYIDYSVPRNAPDLVRKQRAMWHGPLAPGVAVSSAVGPTPPAAGYRFPHT